MLLPRVLIFIDSSNILGWSLLFTWLIVTRPHAFFFRWCLETPFANPTWDLAHLLRIIPILTAYKIEKGQNNERFLVGLRISPTRVQLEDASKEENVQQSDSNHDGTMLQTEPDSHSFRVHDLEMASHCENMKYENIPQKYMLKHIKMSAKQYARH